MPKRLQLTYQHIPLHHKSKILPPPSLWKVSKFFLDFVFSHAIYLIRPKIRRYGSKSENNLLYRICEKLWPKIQRYGSKFVRCYTKLALTELALRIFEQHVTDNMILHYIHVTYHLIYFFFQVKTKMPYACKSQTIWITRLLHIIWSPLNSFKNK